jgi:glucose-6-phosphate isomerase
MQPVLDGAYALLQDHTQLCDTARLGLTLGTLARGGRNKLVLHPDPAAAPLAAWIEQLVAESTGKRGVGILPVSGASVAALAPAADQLHLAIGAGDPPAGGWTLPMTVSGNGLGDAFLRWEILTAIACTALEVNPFDQPHVDLAKARTRELLEAPRAAEGEGIPEDFFRGLQPGDYVAMLCYLDRVVHGSDAERLARELQARLPVPVTLGFGPRYLHSTGQFHKGGPTGGHFLLLTAESLAQVPVPGRPFDFAALHRAQALGDKRVLLDRGYPVAHLHARDPAAALAALATALSTADSNRKEITDHA